MLSTQAIQANKSQQDPMVSCQWGFNKQCKTTEQITETHAPTAPAPATSASILPPAAPEEAHHGPIQHIKVNPLMHQDLWPLAGTGASDTCVARGSRGESGGGADLTSLSASLWSVQPQLRSRVWPLSTGRLLRAVDPCDRPLDPAYPWAWGALFGPGPCGYSPPLHHKPRVRNGQGRTNEVRAAVLGDLCPSEAPIAFWLID